MRSTPWSFVFSTAVLCSTFGLAQESDSDTKQAGRPKPEAKDAAHFPKPLQRVKGNMHDLEKTGFLSVVGVEERAIDQQGNRGWVWTIKTKKPISAGHLRALLNKYRLVRFYVHQKTTKKEAYTGLLHYSEYIEIAAVNRKIFLKDEQVEMWLQLDDSVRRKLAKTKIDSVVFAQLKR